jgi:hypothetical protein
MPPHRERVLRGTVSSEHLVHLFDEAESLVSVVSEFLISGWRRGDSLLVVARPAHWALTAPELELRGCSVADTIASGRLVVLDAATTLATFMIDGDPDHDRFHTSVGTLVRQCCDRSASGITIYGEMVDILAAQGNFHGAERLEQLWNDLSQTCSLRLLCGYSAANFAHGRSSEHLQRICALHDSASARATDLLATWLLGHRRSRYHLDPQ